MKGIVIKEKEPEVVKEKKVVLTDIRHNQVAYLIPGGLNGEFSDIIKFLIRSRIAGLISKDIKVYRKHMEEFWENATIDTATTPATLKSTVQGQNVFVTEEILRRLFNVGGADTDPLFLNDRMVKGCLRRMGFSGKINATSFLKSSFPSQMRYLVHVMVQCLGPKKGGYDVINLDLVHAMVALILNKPFNFTGYLMYYLKGNLTRIDRNLHTYYMYPRFIQKCITSQVQNLVCDEFDLLDVSRMNEKALIGMKSKKSNQANRKPFGAIKDKDYVVRKENEWRNEDSDSGKEDIAEYTPNTDISELKHAEVDKPNQVAKKSKYAKKRGSKGKGKDTMPSLKEGFRVVRAGGMFVRVKDSKKRKRTTEQEEEHVEPLPKVIISQKKKGEKKTTTQVTEIEGTRISIPVPKGLLKKTVKKPTKKRTERVEVVEKEQEVVVEKEKDSVVEKETFIEKEPVVEKEQSVEPEPAPVNEPAQIPFDFGTSSVLDAPGPSNPENFTFNFNASTEYTLLQAQIDHLIKSNGELRKSLDNQKLISARQQLTIMQNQQEIMQLKDDRDKFLQIAEVLSRLK